MADAFPPLHLLTVFFPKGVDRATVSCWSKCGPIQVSWSLKGGAETGTKAFWPDAPVYMVENRATAGHVVVPLTDADDARDVVAVTFTNNGSEGTSQAGLDVALNFPRRTPPSRQDERRVTVSSLAAGESITVNIVLNRPGLGLDLPGGTT